MKKSILDKIRPFFSLIRDFFPYVLLTYLIFFLLEILLPGFVSNNFDLNYLLVAVLILGFFSVFASPIEQKEELPQKSDRNLIIILSLITFIVLLFRTKDMGLAGLAISLVGSLLVAGMSVILIYFPDEDREERIDTINNESYTVSPTIQLPKFSILIYLKPGLILFIMIILVFFAFKQINRKDVSTNQKVPSRTSKVVPIIEEDEEIRKPDEETLQKVSIEVLNGSLKVGSASAMTKFLKENGFNVTRTGDADGSNYNNLLIRFRPEEYGVVRYLIEIIQGIYPSIVREPLSTDSAKIIMILGKP